MKMTVDNKQLPKIDQAVQKMMGALRKRTLDLMQQPFVVDTKTGHNDLVTTVDKNNEQFICIVQNKSTQLCNKKVHSCEMKKGHC